MTRFFSVAKWDAVLQWRAGFYYAGFFVTVAWVALLSQVPHDTLGIVLPPFLLLSLNVTTYYFIAGLVLFEKGEGILHGLVVTPLQAQEYLLSKTTTLTALAVVESYFIVLLSYGRGVDTMNLLGGMASMSAIYALIGFVMVARYDSINQYLMPSFLFVSVLQIPWLSYFGIVENPLFYIIPTQGPLLLLKSAFLPIASWEIMYALISSLFWILISYYLARKAFYDFVIRTQGGG